LQGENITIQIDNQPKRSSGGYFYVKNSLNLIYITSNEPMKEIKISEEPQEFKILHTNLTVLYFSESRQALTGMWVGDRWSTVTEVNTYNYDFIRDRYMENGTSRTLFQSVEISGENVDEDTCEKAIVAYERFVETVIVK
jgi:hypothetical protein